MANIYTCTLATGDIEDLTTATSGEVKINYTLSETSAGNVDSNTTDGVYEAVATYDSANLTLTGYTGVITVNSVLPLTTKTQREEMRVLTHEAEKLGSELVTNGGFDTDISGWTSNGTQFSYWDNGKLRSDPVYSLRRYQDITVPVGTHTLTWDSASISGALMKIYLYEGHAFTTQIDNQIAIEGSNSFEFTTTTGNVRIYLFEASTSDEQTVDNISLIPIVEENKYYIDNVLQDEVSLPDADTYINLDETAVIGYADTISKRSGNFKVWTSVKTAAEQLTAINAVISATKTVVTDQDSNILTDQQGMYMYTNT